MNRLADVCITPFCQIIRIHGLEAPGSGGSSYQAGQAMAYPNSGLDYPNEFLAYRSWWPTQSNCTLYFERMIHNISRHYQLICDYNNKPFISTFWS